MPVIGKKVAGFGKKNELAGPQTHAVLPKICILTILLCIKIRKIYYLNIE
jgi:hypothetical protein